MVMMDEVLENNGNTEELLGLDNKKIKLKQNRYFCVA